MIDSHLSRFYKNIIANYKHNKLVVDLSEINNDNKVVRHLFNVLLENIDQGSCFQFDAHKLELIKQQKRVIIYGAGMVARKVLHILDEAGIGIYGFAVSDKTGNPNYIMGTKVYGIEELLEYRKDSTVLIGVSSKHQKSIREKLNELQFEKVIDVL
jgi:FlaA1/EpsC-like NDP-sugar epimerase